VRSYYSEGGLRKWVKDNWVDIANKKSDGSYKGQRAGAVRRKQAKANTGPTPSRAATFAKKKKS